MRSLVTGGSGFFGHVLVQKLLAQGDEVRNFDLNPADDEFEGVEFHRGDIRDPDAVRRATRGIDVIYHNVAQQPLSKNPRLMHAVNLGGTSNLLSAAQANRVAKIIFTSSTAVFGIPRELPIRRSTRPSPCEPYGRTKVEAEQLCEKYINKGLDITIIRPRTILGHGRLGLFQMLFEWVREGRNVPVMGNGANVFQFIHAHDLAEASIRAAQKSGSKIYNIGTDRFGTMRQVLEALCEHAKTGSSVKNVPATPARLMLAVAGKIGGSPLGPYHYMAYGKSNYFDISDAVAELDWHPTYSNEEMLIASYDWYLQNREDALNCRWTSLHKSPVKQGILRFLIGLI